MWETGKLFFSQGIPKQRLETTENFLLKIPPVFSGGNQPIYEKNRIQL